MASSSDTGRSTQKGSARKKSSSSPKGSASKQGGSRKAAARKQRASAPRAESKPVGATQVARQAAGELLELTGKAAEGVTGIERTDEGWTVQVEVVEVRRIPDTTDVLAVYEVTTDERGALQGYRRVRRYARGSAGES